MDRRGRKLPYKFSGIVVWVMQNLQVEHKWQSEIEVKSPISCHRNKGLTKREEEEEKKEAAISK
jgi:hypothetical protein